MLIFKNLFDKHFPSVTRKIELDNKVYINNEIKELIKEKNKFQKLAAKWPISYGSLYKSMRNRVTKLIRKSKNQHYKNKLLECAGDSRSTWKIINDLMNKNKSRDSNLSNNFDSFNSNINTNDVVNSFNNHFSSVGPMLAREII